MSNVAKELVDGLVDLAALQVKLGNILADAVAGSPASAEAAGNNSSKTHGEISQAEIAAAAEVILTGMLDGYDGGFQSLLRTNFPQHRIEELARAALEAAAACRKDG